MNPRNGHGLFKLVIFSITLPLLFAAVTATTVAAAGYPERSISIIVGSSPGGFYDIQARLLGEHWPQYLPNNVPMVVRNVPGGGGIRSANETWVTEPDGYTIAQIKTGAYILAQVQHPAQVKFKMSDWQYIGRYTQDISVFLTRKDIAAKIKSYKDLVAMAKDKPLLCSTGGVGSSMHTNGIIFAEETKIPISYVHFKGSQEALTSLMRHEVDFNILSISPAQKADPETLQILFIFNDDKGMFSSVAPTALDFGVPSKALQAINDNPVFSAPRALAVVPGTPANIVKILRDSFWKMVTNKEVEAAFKKAGDFLNPLGGEEFQKLIPQMVADTEKFAALMKTKK